MKITLFKIANSVIVLEKLKNQSLNFNINYWIMRNIKILSDTYNFFVMTREEIYEKYGLKIKSNSYPMGSYFTNAEDGTYIFNLKNDSDGDLFEKELNDLMNMECDDIEPYLISADILKNAKNINLNTDDVFAIDYLLSE